MADFFERNDFLVPEFAVHTGDLPSSARNQPTDWEEVEDRVDSADITNSDATDLEDSTEDLESIFDSLTSLKITKEIGKGMLADMTFAYGATTDLPPYAFMSPAVDSSERTLIIGGYRELGESSTVKVLGLNPSKLELDAETKVLIEGGVSPSEASSNVEVRSSSLLFGGTIGKPRLQGSDRGIITYTAQAISALMVTGDNVSSRVNTLTIDKRKTVDGQVITIPAEQEHKQKAFIISGVSKDKVNAAQVITSVCEALFGQENKARDTDEFLRFGVGYDVSSLRDYDASKEFKKNYKSIHRLLSYAEPTMDYLSRVCKELGVFYFCVPTRDGREMLVFMPSATSKSKDYFSLVRNKGFYPGFRIESEQALLLVYGEAVVRWNWSSSNTPQVTSLKGGKKQITFLDQAGRLVRFEVDKAAVEAAYKKGFNLRKALKLASRNPTAFILQFTKAFPGSGRPQIRPQPAFGQNGFTLNLTLKRALPGLLPGTIIYFDAYRMEDQDVIPLIPNYVKGLYQVQKVTDSFQSTGQLWTQQLVCKR